MKGSARWILLVLIVLLLGGIAATYVVPSWFGGGAPDTAGGPPAESSPAPVVRSVALDITGMHCGGCVVMITEALEKTPGVVSAKVSLEEERAEVALSTEEDITPALLAAVEGAGYHAAVSE